MSDAENVATFPAAFIPREQKFRLEDFDTLTASRVHWRVKGLWPATGVCFIGGPSMSGKSFWALDAVARVCRGEDVLGRKAKAAGAVYIASEGAAGVRNRITGLRSKIGRLDGAFQFIAQAPNLNDPDDVADLETVLTDARHTLMGAGHDLGVVVIDTLSASIPGADENSAKDMSPVLASLQTLALKLECLVLVIAHTGKDETRGLRGWSGLLANADGLIMLDAPEGEARGGAVIKVKDGESGDRFGFELQRLTIGQDEDGDDITTCVIEERDPVAKAKAGRQSTVAMQNAETIKAAFNRIFPEKSARIMAPGADGAFGVSLSDLKDEALKMGLGDIEPDCSGMADADKKKALRDWNNKRGKDFKRALDRLRQADYRLENEHVWQISANRRSPA